MAILAQEHVSTFKVETSTVNYSFVDVLVKFVVARYHNHFKCHKSIKNPNLHHVWWSKKSTLLPFAQSGILLYFTNNNTKLDCVAIAFSPV